MSSQIVLAISVTIFWALFLKDYSDHYLNCRICTFIFLFPFTEFLFSGLDYNELNRVPEELFRGLSNLEEMCVSFLRSNTLKVLFRHLNDNNLTSLSDSVFCGLSSLTLL